MKLLSRSVFASPKKLILIGSVLLVVLLAGGYALWSRQVWSSYRPTYTQSYDSVKSDLNKTAALAVATPEERAAVLAELKKLNTKIEGSSQQECHVHSLVSWQAKVLKDLEASRVECEEQFAQVATIEQPLSQTIAYLESDNALAAALATIAQPGELADDAWENQVTVWQAAIDATEKVAATSEFAPVKQVALERMQAVKAAWSAVIAAHQAKDKSKYLAAQADLAKALDGMSAISVAGEKEMTTLASALEKATASVAN